MRLSKESGADAFAIPPPDNHSALLLIDLQNDFFSGGALGVPRSDSLVPIINTYIKHFSRQGWPILATRDWHPSNHCSFQEQGGTLPVHCVQGSQGAQFHSDLVMPPGTIVISKGTDAKSDARSGFEGSSLADRLEDLDITRLYVLGPALQDAVQHTVLEACQLGFQVIVLYDAVGDGIHQQPQTQKAWEAMISAGGHQAIAKDFAIPTS